MEKASSSGAQRGSSFHDSRDNRSGKRRQTDQFQRPDHPIHPGCPQPSVPRALSRGSSESFEYDLNGNLRVWDRNDKVTYTFDELDRLQDISSPTTNDHISFTFDELDRIKTMTDGTGTTSYGYTDNYLLDQITHPGNKTLKYHFDQGDRLFKMVDPEGAATEYGLSDRNELTSVSHDGQTVRYSHDLVGRTYRTEYPNGVTAQRTFSERNQLLFKSYSKGSSPLITLKYAFNQVGQRVVDEKIAANGSVLKRFEYNARRQLIGSTRRAPNGRVTTQDYKLDDNDNITNKDGQTFANNNADQLTQAGSIGLAYNSAGQATSVGSETLSFRLQRSDQKHHRARPQRPIPLRRRRPASAKNRQRRDPKVPLGRQLDPERIPGQRHRSRRLHPGGRSRRHQNRQRLAVLPQRPPGLHPGPGRQKWQSRGDLGLQRLRRDHPDQRGGLGLQSVPVYRSRNGRRDRLLSQPCAALCTQIREVFGPGPESGMPGGATSTVTAAATPLTTSTPQGCWAALLPDTPAGIQGIQVALLPDTLAGIQEIHSTRLRKSRKAWHKRSLPTTLLVIEGFLNEATGSVLSQGQREILKLAIKRLNSTAAQEASRICNGATARRIPGELQNMW
ncbi:MAG: hypothetical protein V9G12_12150 [Microthrixaceae bacterium]